MSSLLIADITGESAVDLIGLIERTTTEKGAKDGGHGQPLTDPSAAGARACVLEGEATHCGRSLDGEIFTLPEGKKGQVGLPSNSPFSGPSTCREPQGKIIIADDNNHLIHLYDPDQEGLDHPRGKAQPQPSSTVRTELLWPPRQPLGLRRWNDRVVVLRNY